MNSIQIKLLFFAAARERSQCAESYISLESGSTLHDLQSHVFIQFPTLSEIASHLRWSVNHTFENQLDRVLYSGDEVAIIPPISGG